MPQKSKTDSHSREVNQRGQRGRGVNQRHNSKQRPHTHLRTLAVQGERIGSGGIERKKSRGAEPDEVRQGDALPQGASKEFETARLDKNQTRREVARFFKRFQGIIRRLFKIACARGEERKAEHASSPVTG